ncbi:flavin reductase family protein [Actinopolyspora halophila]|uniref:flavin reductase family protein n=1 Tax=Actinopolyspora halophila TaxID=1850 RepID=UPI000A03DD2A|nr:flavin reductase [Actinopolyspora halophila]
MSVDPLSYLTSTVGLVCTKNADNMNVMSAEWTYFVARDPLHIAVGIADYNWTQSRAVESKEFSVTLCDISQTAVAVFAGSFSGQEIDKTSSDALELANPSVIDTPYVRGGVFNAECRVRQVVELPGYLLIIGEAVWSSANSVASARPLVKHGDIHELGPRISDRRVVTTAQLSPDGSSVRVAATAYDAPHDAPWEVVVTDGSGEIVLEEHLEPDGHVLLVDFTLPRLLDLLDVVVRRHDAPSGWAHSTRPGDDCASGTTSPRRLSTPSGLPNRR